MDFTCKKYEKLLKTLLRQGFYFQTFEEFINNPLEKVIILRHDIDKRPDYAFRFALIEFSLGIKGSYHFRIVKDSNKPEFIRKIIGMGHELGYHYEDLNLNCYKKKDTETKCAKAVVNEIGAEYQGAYFSFKSNLEYFRKYYPVKVISMHGSPISKIDNRDLWKIYNYHNSRVICEPYFDIDYSKVLYLTDTGRRWNGQKFNVRDKVFAGFGSTKAQPLGETYVFSSTSDIIKAVEQSEFPNQVIINTHPQRWTNNLLSWSAEYLFQGLINIVKYFIVLRGTKKQ